MSNEAEKKFVTDGLQHYGDATGATAAFHRVLKPMLRARHQVERHTELVGDRRRQTQAGGR